MDVSEHCRGNTKYIYMYFAEARKNNYLVVAGVCVLCLRTAHQQCGAVAEGKTGGHCWGRCYHGEGLDSFCSSSVVPSLSSSLSITLSVSLFLLQPTPACPLASPPLPLFPLLCLFCPLLSPRHSPHRLTFSLVISFFSLGFKWFSGTLRIDQVHVDPP